MRVLQGISKHKVLGCLLGTAVGDAIGLPSEGVPKSRLAKLFPPPYRHRLLFGRGLTSDDTEHTCMVAQALIASQGEPEAFARSLARQLKLWMLMLPSGAGLATAKGCCRLLVGLPPERSGVFSAGNGPAMRSALIGLSYGHDLRNMRTLVRASTRMTHTDPKAEQGALAVALAAYVSAGGESPQEFVRVFRDELMDEDGLELLTLIEKALESAAAGQSTEAFAGAMGWGRGVSGYVCATVPIVLHAWSRYPKDYRAAVSSVIACGGDTDTTAAIVGAIVGAGVGPDGIPEEWLSRLAEWPRSVKWMQELAERTAAANDGEEDETPMPVCLPFVLARNVLFFVVVLLHGFRRLLPPY